MTSDHQLTTRAILSNLKPSSPANFCRKNIHRNNKCTFFFKIIALTGTLFLLSVSSSLEHLQLRRWSETLLIKTVETVLQHLWTFFFFKLSRLSLRNSELWRRQKKLLSRVLFQCEGTFKSPFPSTPGRCGKISNWKPPIFDIPVTCSSWLATA